MSVINDILKQFVGSVVRQVGRDGGKVLSNKMFKGKHGTPIYRSNHPNTNSTQNKSGNTVKKK